MTKTQVGSRSVDGDDKVRTILWGSIAGYLALSLLLFGYADSPKGTKWGYPVRPWWRTLLA
jgi:hypothetical protein